MPAPKLAPVQRVFREAIDHHRSRVPISDRDLGSVSLQARARSFWVSGLARHASVVETHRLIDKALLSGTTPAQFRADFTKLLAENGGAVLPVHRQNLIFTNANVLAYTSGRMTQLRDPDVLAERPILMYPLGPHDAKTTVICLRLEGLMAPADSPVWNRVAPPNHHRERHAKLLSLTREQADARGKVWSGDEPYPSIDGQQIVPDPGFDHAPSLLATDSKHLQEEFAGILRPRAAKTPRDYDLVDASEFPEGAAIDLPELAAADEGWEALRSTLRFSDDLDSTITVDALGDGAIVNRESFDAIFAGEPELTPLLKRLLEEPSEVWLVPVDTDAGVTAVKRYIGIFSDGEGTLVLFWADQAPSGWLARGGRVSAEELEALRGGYLVATRFPRKGASA